MSEISQEVANKIRKLHFYTKQLATEIVGGEYRSAFKGRGIEFEELRKYVPSDDIRSIDWKVTARVGEPYVKRYKEERELTVLIAIDISTSMLTSSTDKKRSEVVAEVGALLALIAKQNNDKVGLLTFTDQVEKYIPPRKTKHAAYQVLHEVLSDKEHHPQTDIVGAIDFLNKTLKRSAIIFLLSDFNDPKFLEVENKRKLAGFAKRHDVTAIKINDLFDFELPETALVRAINPETNQEFIIDCSASNIKKHNKLSTQNLKKLDQELAKYNIGRISLQTNKDYLPQIRKFLRLKASS